MGRLVLTLLVLALPVASAMAQPMAYSVNSDSPSAQQSDSLYEIDLSTGEARRIGKTRPFEVLILPDIEGLAFAEDTKLYGVDDADETLLHISTVSGLASPVQGHSRNTRLSQGNYDFGLTFTCSGALLMASDQNQQLFHLDMETGEAVSVGNTGSLGAAITGIAGWGDKVYGIGQGIDTESGATLNPNLYEIDISAGTTRLIGPLGMGTNFAPYGDAGLAFDADGNLWALTDRRSLQGVDSPSQIIQIEPKTGAATLIAEIPDTEGALGFESLAIAPPGGCAGTNGPGPQPGRPHGIPTLSQWSMLLLTLLLAALGSRRLRQFS